MRSLLLALALLGGAELSKFPFPVTYDPDARRPYNPSEPLWTGPTPCAIKVQGTGSGSDATAAAPKRVDKWKQAFPNEKETRTWGRGALLAEVMISSSGRISSVRILRSNSEAFDTWVLREFAHHRYEPARLDGKPVEMCMVYTSRPHP